MKILDHFENIIAAESNPFVLELGACDGYHSGLLLSKLENLGRPYQFTAFEPDPRLVPKVTTVIKQVQAATKVGKTQFYNWAVGAKDAVTDFYLSSGEETRPGAQFQKFYGSSSIRKPTHICKEMWPDMEFMQSNTYCVRLDTLFGYLPQPITFIWADIQGAECDLIAGGKRALANTKYLYTEYYDKPIYEEQISLSRILELLPTFRVVEQYEDDNVLLVNTTLVLDRVAPNNAGQAATETIN